MQIPARLRRQISILIPVLNALLFFGILTSILEINQETNIASTGITLKIIFAILNCILIYWIYKRRIS